MICLDCQNGIHEVVGAAICDCSCHERRKAREARQEEVALPDEVYDPPPMGRFEDEPR